MEILLPPNWPRPKDYASGVSAYGHMVLAAGMIDWGAQGVLHTDNLAGRVRQTLQNIVGVLTAGDAKLEHIVHMTWYVTDKKAYVAAYSETGKAFRELIGSSSIVMMTMEVGALVEDRVEVEVEVTAVVSDQGDPRTDGT